MTTKYFLNRIVFFLFLKATFLIYSQLKMDLEGFKNHFLGIPEMGANCNDVFNIGNSKLVKSNIASDDLMNTTIIKSFIIIKYTTEATNNIKYNLICFNKNSSGTISNVADNTATNV